LPAASISTSTKGKDEAAGAKASDNNAAEESKDAAQATKLQAAWRYQDLVEEKMLGMADASKSDINGGQTENFRFDSSKPMGKAVANLPSRVLDVQALLIQLTYDEADK
jgi:hypothetical protein